MSYKLFGFIMKLWSSRYHGIKAGINDLNSEYNRDPRNRLIYLSWQIGGEKRYYSVNKSEKKVVYIEKMELISISHYTNN